MQSYSMCCLSRFIAVIPAARYKMENVLFISLWLLRHATLIHFLCVPGQTPGGNVEAAGQSGGSHRHSGRDPSLACGQRGIGGKYKRQQSPARATQSPGGKVDCMVHFLTFPRLFLISHHFPCSPCPFLSPLKCQIDRYSEGTWFYLCHLFGISGHAEGQHKRMLEDWTLKYWYSTVVLSVSFLLRMDYMSGVVKQMTWHFDTEWLLQRSIN